MHVRLLAAICLCVSFSSPGYSQGSGCAEALVLATYNRVDVANSDWRVAAYVTESQYNEVKQKAGLNAVIYGVPVGANYSDYQKSLQEKTSSYKESLTQSQATNVMWTGLDPQSSNAYAECLKTRMFSQPGVHVDVKSATRLEVSVVIVWTPIGSARDANLRWSWAGTGVAALPKIVKPGSYTAVLPRPEKQQILAVNFEGYSDSLIIEPFPAPPIVEIRMVETSEEYRSGVIEGWGTNFSNPTALCTPEKPPGWTIVKVYDFHLESPSERNECGKWTTCGGAETDTPRRACRIVSVQGHTDNKYSGYGRAVAVFHVTWRHPANSK